MNSLNLQGSKSTYKDQLHFYELTTNYTKRKFGKQLRLKDQWKFILGYKVQWNERTPSILSLLAFWKCVFGMQRLPLEQREYDIKINYP